MGRLIHPHIGDIVNFKLAGIVYEGGEVIDSYKKGNVTAFIVEYGGNKYEVLPIEMQYSQFRKEDLPQKHDSLIWKQKRNF